MPREQPDPAPPLDCLTECPLAPRAFLVGEERREVLVLEIGEDDEATAERERQGIVDGNGRNSTSTRSRASPCLRHAES